MNALRKSLEGRQRLYAGCSSYLKRVLATANRGCGSTVPFESPTAAFRCLTALRGSSQNLIWVKMHVHSHQSHELTWSRAKHSVKSNAVFEDLDTEELAHNAPPH